ncbi:amidohydrolase family protein [Granulicella sp. WH15]|uniref:amidohydrolase family protein n=1 Tax=Granulicella sp. WH15 TaxID=2602070 RepID=UPI001C703D15|nr:amidohydrolase family protein [Granulicella sp. WH15]
MKFSRGMLLSLMGYGLVVTAHAQDAVTKTPVVKAIKFGKLIDGTGKVTTNAVVVIKGDRIESVGTGDSAIPSGAQVIDMSNRTGIPGLIDVHTHMTYWWDKNPRTTPNEGAANLLPQELAFLAGENARNCIDIGVTTVRDMAARNYTDIAMRNLINRGVMVGPRMFVAGPAIAAGGAVPRWGQAFPWVPPSQNQASGVEGVMTLARQEMAAGADFIKMFGSSGGFQTVETHQTFTYEEMQAAVNVAHTNGKRIAIHSYGASGARDAVKAGADTVEHAIDIDDATFAEMNRKHIIYVPTAYHNVWYIQNYKEFKWPESENLKIQAYQDKVEETTRRAIKAGVRIAMGSDAVFELFGHNTEELTYLVKSGMTPAQALAAATVNGAAALGMENDLGQVTPGHYADIVAVDGDPLSDISVVVHNVKWVMKGGKVMVDKTAK